MKRFVTKGIILNRTDYGEADRILTFLTDDHGKVKAIAKSVRKSQSKLAGGIELFSVSDLSLIVGRGEVNTLISSRLVRHYGNIVKDIERTKAAYEILKMVGRATQDQPEPAYFKLLDQTLAGLDDLKLDLDLSRLWFNMQLLKLAGHMPNLRSDLAGTKLAVSKHYSANLDQMRFEPAKSGSFNAKHIKFLRLGFAAARPQILQRVEGAGELTSACQPLVETMLRSHVRI